MLWAFFFGIIQGLLVGFLLDSLNLNFFGFLNIALNGTGAFTNAILFLGANILFYLFFSKKLLSKSPVYFIVGVVIGVILL